MNLQRASYLDTYPCVVIVFPFVCLLLIPRLISCFSIWPLYVCVCLYVFICKHTCITKAPSVSSAGCEHSTDDSWLSVRGLWQAKAFLGSYRTGHVWLLNFCVSEAGQRAPDRPDSSFIPKPQSPKVIGRRQIELYSRGPPVLHLRAKPLWFLRRLAAHTCFKQSGLCGSCAGRSSGFPKEWGSGAVPAGLLPKLKLEGGVVMKSGRQSRQPSAQSRKTKKTKEDMTREDEVCCRYEKVNQYYVARRGTSYR